MKSKRGLQYCVAAFLAAEAAFVFAQQGHTEALNQPMFSERTGDHLSCADCHAHARVIRGGKAGLGNRRSDALVVSALIDTVSEAHFLAAADPFDRDGDNISGRVAWVLSLPDQRAVPGRFGWKASVGTLEDQIANALIMDMGLENELLTFSTEACESDKPGCVVAAGPRAGAQASDAVHRLATEVRSLARLPALPDPEGLQLFTDTGCAACHHPYVRNTEGEALPLFTDLLLHDMGPGLAEDRTVGSATRSEWRTASLLGLNQKSGLLHDGRAATVKQAVEAHGGEAQYSTTRFLALSETKMLALLRFLRGL